MTYDMLGTGLVLVVAVATVGWFILRLRRFSEAHRLSDEKLEAVKASVQKSLDEEAMTRRIVTGIAESLIPTLQHLNVDVKDLNALLNEMRESTQEAGATIPDLIARAEQSSRYLANAIEDLVTLRDLAEGVVVEQSNRLKAIDIALDFLSSRVQELGRDLTVPRPVETQLGISSVEEALSESSNNEPKRNDDFREGNAEALQPSSDDREDRGEEPALSDGSSSNSNWRNRQWAVTDDGMEALGNVSHSIEKERLGELDTPGIASWPLQMAEKPWVDFEAFFEAFTKALEIHRPQGFEAIDMVETEQRARARAANTAKQQS